MKEHLTATFNFSDANTANPPNKLKHSEIIQGPDKEKWLQGIINELDRLTQGFGEAKGSNKFFFIPKNNAPKGKKLLALEHCVP